MATHKTEVAVRTPAQKAGTTAKQRRIELPRKWWGWAIVAVISLVIVYAFLLFCGMHTGSFGILPVIGDSMASIMPWGSQVLVVPINPSDGDFVVARVERISESIDPADQQPSFVVKRVQAGKLISTDTQQSYDNYHITGKVVVVIPAQRVLWWTNRGAQNPASSHQDPTPEERAAIQARHKKEIASERQRCMAKGEVLTLDKSEASDYDSGTGYAMTGAWEKPFSTPLLLSQAEVFLVEVPDDPVVNGKLFLKTDGKWKEVATLRAGKQSPTFSPVKATAAKIRLTTCETVMLREIHFFR